jgi:hypothetical protein
MPIPTQKDPVPGHWMCPHEWGGRFTRRGALGILSVRVLACACCPGRDVNGVDRSEASQEETNYQRMGPGDGR